MSKVEGREGRVILIVLDSVGVGELPDAAEFGDEGANTLKHVKESVQELKIPNLVQLGLYNIDETGLPPIESPKGAYGKCAELSKAKDTTNGHFEMAGLIVENPYRVFGKCFPDRIIKELEKQIGRSVIGNYPASGTEIIQELGEEHVNTGSPIVYLSADSIMQIAMHEEIISLKEQYEICQIARAIMCGDDTVGRIICRPFLGNRGTYYRTENRKDFAVDPPGETMLDILKNVGKDVIAVGKIEDIFNRRGITQILHSRNNKEGEETIIQYMQQEFDGILFANLVDFDMLYGHRNDPKGYAKALEQFDQSLPAIQKLMKPSDMLIITADHGCDPCHKGTDHTREYIPLLIYGKDIQVGCNFHTRESFADIAATICDYFGIPVKTGKSLLKIVRGERK